MTDALRFSCDECGADPGEPCRPYCTAPDSACTCISYIVDHSDPEPLHPENVDRELDPDCPVHKEER